MRGGNVWRLFKRLTVECMECVTQSMNTKETNTQYVAFGLITMYMYII